MAIVLMCVFSFEEDIRSHGKCVSIKVLKVAWFCLYDCLALSYLCYSHFCFPLPPLCQQTQPEPEYGSPYAWVRWSDNFAV